ncbi:MAG: hypothetical protein ACRDZX_02365 [Acidimicrobiales bacterium]
MQRHHGLNFLAPFPLGEPCSTGSQADVVVRVGATKPVGTSPPGPVVADLRVGDRALYTVYRSAEGYLVRAHGTCEFRVDRDATSVVCEPGPGCTEGLVAVLVGGTVASFLLTLRGYAVLHASAVRWRGQTLAFVGRSGKGKTTLAALCCAAGAELVSDDVVTLVHDGGGISCFGLGRELRLREVASGIADLFPPPGPGRRRTADERLAIAPARAAAELNPIAAVVLPCPVRDRDDVTTEVLAPSAAVAHLLGNSRVPAMVPANMQRSYFEAVADLAAAVPVVQAGVPWGPPWTTAFVPGLLGNVLGAGPGR